MLTTIEVKAIVVLIKGAVIVKTTIKTIIKATIKAKENTSVII